MWKLIVLCILKCLVFTLRKAWLMKLCVCLFFSLWLLFLTQTLSYLKLLRLLKWLLRQLNSRHQAGWGCTNRCTRWVCGKKTHLMATSAPMFASSTTQTTRLTTIQTNQLRILDLQEPSPTRFYTLHDSAFIVMKHPNSMLAAAFANDSQLPGFVTDTAALGSKPRSCKEEPSKKEGVWNFFLCI